MKCRHCGGKTQVLDSRMLGKTRRRGRKCLACGVSEQTVELWLKERRESPTVLEEKIDNVLEDFEQFQHANKTLFDALAALRTKGKRSS